KIAGPVGGVENSRAGAGEGSGVRGSFRAGGEDSRAAQSSEYRDGLRIRREPRNVFSGDGARGWGKFAASDCGSAVVGGGGDGDRAGDLRRAAIRARTRGGASRHQAEKS